ncbi:MAG: hypothetical protein VW551_06085 [Euryarchaeota archaeon]|jgi:hypothetical protein
MRKRAVVLLTWVFISQVEDAFIARAFCPYRLYHWLYFENFGEYPWQTLVMSR